MSVVFPRPKRWSTHMPMLIKSLEVSVLPVLELGSGLFSTPFLHWYCKGKKIKLVTYESDPEYYKFATDFRSRSHSVRFTKDWEDIDTTTHWGVVLIDQGGVETRIKSATKLKDTADYIVLHDSQYKNMYEDVFKHFKYRYDWKECRPWTTVVSNFKDLSKWTNENN